ncbi:MAG: NAD(+) synthase [Planctomycetota bacterium]|nr:NAD(+) synthase [Planctomycetota bacterium]
MHPAGFLRISAVSTATCVANPQRNRIAIDQALVSFQSSDIVLLPELCLSGYTCGELFLQDSLLDACRVSLVQLAKRIDQQLVVVGLPLAVRGRLYNVAAVLSGGCVLGLVPKTHLPNYSEFYEARWFHSGAEADFDTVAFDGLGQIPFGTDLLFQCAKATVGIEICEDLWVPIPPSSRQAIAGANVLLNLSASNETIAKANYRKQLVSMQSGKCIGAYAYASAGPSESTTDLVFGAHCMIAENGSLLAESKRIGTGLDINTQSSNSPLVSFATADIDLGRLDRDRRAFQTMHQTADHSRLDYRFVPFELLVNPGSLCRWIDPHPFVPASKDQLHERCAEIFEIQCAALAKRVGLLPENTPLSIGVSGGLDSTLALMVAVEMCKKMGWPSTRIVGMTMPGFGTTKQSKSNAIELMDHLEVTSQTIDIRDNCFETFRSLQHAPFGICLEGLNAQSLQSRLEKLPNDQRNDLVFENVQARMRTMLLMNRGFVLGTGDMSEQALGWSTYNADHMSMYNVNGSIPKTLVKFLIRYVADHLAKDSVGKILIDIVQTPISPELLPLSADQNVLQSTEDTIGPYELHDFFLFHLVRGGATPSKILMLAQHAVFDRAYSPDQIRDTLKVFLKRFFASQYKRSCVPDGPKVGSVSLSPRGDWRMPSDADAEAWIADL